MKPVRSSSSSSGPLPGSGGTPSVSRVLGREPERPAQPEKPDPRAVSERARALWRERGCPVGRDEEIWLAAERELSGVGASAGFQNKDAA